MQIIASRLCIVYGTSALTRDLILGQNGPVPMGLYSEFKLTLECAIECCFRFVSDLSGDVREGMQSPEVSQFEPPGSLQRPFPRENKR